MCLIDPLIVIMLMIIRIKIFSTTNLLILILNLEYDLGCEQHRII